jgi:hypothetical protein
MTDKTEFDVLKELSSTSDALKTIAKAVQNVDFEDLDEIKGEPGKTPEKGKDYFTPEEIKNFKEEITPVKGKDYNDGKDGKDGKDGERGPKGDKGLSGIDGNDGKDGKEGKPGKNGKDGSPDTPEQIVEKITSLEGGKRLSYKSLKDTPDIFNAPQGKGGMAGTGYLKEITDVAIDNPANNDGLVYDATTKKWKNSQSVNTDEKVKTSANDTTPSYLNSKISVSGGLTKSITSPAGDEVVNIAGPDLTPYASLKKTVVDKTDDYPVVVADTGKILTMSNAGTKTFTLPVIAAGDIGTQITFVKRGAGKVVIQANTGQYIDDSTSAGTIYDDQAAELTSTITLLAISTTQWVIVSANGIWITT